MDVLYFLMFECILVLGLQNIHKYLKIISLLFNFKIIGTHLLRRRVTTQFLGVTYFRKQFFTRHFSLLLIIYFCLFYEQFKVGLLFSPRVFVT